MQFSTPSLASRQNKPPYAAGEFSSGKYPRLLEVKENEFRPCGMLRLTNAVGLETSDLVVSEMRAGFLGAERGYVKGRAEGSGVPKGPYSARCGRW